MKKRLFMLILWVIFLFPFSTSMSEEKDFLTIYPIREKTLWGFMNREGKVVVEPAYAQVSPWSGKYAAVTEDGEKWGLIDAEGTLLFPCEYEIEWLDGCDSITISQMDPEATSNQSMGKCGLFNLKTGKFSGFLWKKVKIIEDASVFPVQGESGLWGYGSADEGEIISCRFYRADYVHEGWAGVGLKEKERTYVYDALIDLQGNLLFAPEGYDIINWDGVSNGWIQVQNENGFGFMDTKGNIVLQPQWHACTGFHGNFAVVEELIMTENSLEEIDWDYFYIDRTGRRLEGVLAPAEGDDNAYTFVNGVITTFSDSGPEEDYLVVIDEEGDPIFDTRNDPDIMWIFHYLEYDRAWYIDRNCYEADIDSEEFYYGLIDRKGQRITPPVFFCKEEGGAPFIEGLALVVYQEKWGFIDLDGNFIIPAIWDYAENFQNGLARVEKDGKMMYIDTEGQIVWKEESQESANIIPSR